MKTSSDNQKLLYRISSLFNSDLKIDRVLANVLNLTVEQTGADNGSIIIFDEMGAVAHKILARVGMPPEKQQAVIAEVLTTGLAGWVVNHREGSLIADVQADERWVSFEDDILVDGSAVSVPLIRRDRVVGVVTLRHHQKKHFGQEHLSLLSFLA